MTKAPTKRERFAQLRTIVEDALTSTDATDNDAALREDLLGFIDHEVELLDRKRNTKPTKNQRLNEALKEDILDILTEGDARATDIAKGLGDDFAVQKATALLTQLVKAGLVERIKGEKGVTLFHLAE